VPGQERIAFHSRILQSLKQDICRNARQVKARPSQIWVRALRLDRPFEGDLKFAKVKIGASDTGHGLAGILITRAQAHGGLQMLNGIF